MVNDKKPIEFGALACDSLMHKFKAEDLPPKGVLFYHQGVFLSGMQNIYYLSGEKKYFNYIKEYVDSVIGENGELIGYDPNSYTPDSPELLRISLQLLDHKQPTVILYNLYDETGEEKYMNAIKQAGESMYYWPVNRFGGYWHMLTQPNQMWLDGAYMAGPLSCMYAKRFGKSELRERAINQILIMNEHMKDEKSGLYFHGWDDSKAMIWADSKTGLSSQIWARAVGWYAVAILDILELIPENHPKAEKLKRIEHELLTALEKYQDENTGMWYEVVDKPEKKGNWVESSGTSLFIYSYAKAVRMGICSEDEFNDVIEKGYKGMIDNLYLDDEGYVVIDKVCVGTCIDSGTYDHYINRETVKNDLHGAGAFILMCAEMQRYRDFINN